MKILSENRKVKFDFAISETLEAGIVLVGTEIKSLKVNNCVLTDCFVTIKDNEAFVYNMHIPHFSFGNINNHEEKRVRKLLMHKKQIINLNDKIKRERISILVSKIYLKDGKAKVELVVGKGKKLHDKRQSEKEKDIKKNMRQGLFE